VSAAPVDARHRDALRRWLVSGALPSPAGEAEAGALVEAAREQRLVALLHAAVEASGGEAWPRAVRESLADEGRRQLVRGVGQLDLAARVEALLAARGLRALPLKGAALAESLYASPAERPMADVDMFALDDWPSSVCALEEADFACAERADHAWSFVDPVTRGLVELHRTVTSCGGVFPLDAGALWSRARPASGQVRRVPSPADLLVQIAQHALFQHGGVLWLVQWLDLRRLLERDPPDPARLAAAAPDARTLRCVRAALSAAALIVGAPLCPRLPGEGALPSSLRGWLDEVRRDPLVAVSPAEPPLARLRWALAAGRRWSLVTGTLRPPPADGSASAVGSAAAVARRAALLVRRWGATVRR
jgi:putative nucleotidyltransferase-like protein